VNPQTLIEIAACPECRRRMKEADAESESLGRGRGAVIVWSRCATCTERLRGAPTP